MVIFNSYHPLMVIFEMLHGHRAQVILHGIEDLEPQSREVRPSLARSRWSLAGDDWVVLVEKHVEIGFKNFNYYTGYYQKK